MTAPISAPWLEGSGLTLFCGSDWAESHRDVVIICAALPDLTLPTLVVVGRYDVICGVRWADELHDLIPNSRLLILERSGHLGHVEEPTEFANGILEFVESVSTAQSTG